jgi:squalene-hopene/tetraprenyl-beta-curcumene cyclase
MRSTRLLIAGLVLVMMFVPSLMISQQKAATPAPKAAAAPAGQASAQMHKDLLAAMDRGVAFLIQNQKADGGWEDHVGITALAATAILKYPGESKYKQGPEVKKALAYIAAQAKPDGGIYGKGHENYSTATAVMALVASGNPEYKPLIEKGQKYMTGIQVGADGKVTKTDKNFGGIGYNGQQRADLPNLAYALEALKASGIPENSPVWQRAVQFIQRTQNRSESNDQSYTGNDGGFAYGPGLGWEGTGTNSYGSMTYAGLLSYSYANVKKGDPRVEAAVNWIKQHYTVEENPGVGQKTVYYYYMVFAKALKAYGDPVIVDAQGRRHNWREELGKKLLELQHKEGFWVNTEPAEWQDNKVLVTAFTLIALESALQ